jgi:hypothetical protein
VPFLLKLTVLLTAYESYDLLSTQGSDDVIVYRPDKILPKKNKDQVTMEVAWKLGYYETLKSNIGSTFKWLHGEMICESCCPSRNNFCDMQVAEPKYIEVMRTSKRFSDHSFLCAFQQMLNHFHHQETGKNSIQSIICFFHPKSSYVGLIEEECLPLKAETDKIVSVWHRSARFVTMELQLNAASRRMIVYDGYNIEGQWVMTWIEHAIYTLKRACLLPLDSEAKFVEMGGKNSTKHLVIETPNEGMIELALDVFMPQHDGHNCGAIAGLKLMDIFDVKGSETPVRLGTFREICMDRYTQVLELCSRDIGVNVSEKRKKEERNKALMKKEKEKDQEKETGGEEEKRKERQKTHVNGYKHHNRRRRKRNLPVQNPQLQYC